MGQIHFHRRAGAKFNIVLGYQGGGPIDLAVEKGAIHCRAMTLESFMAREPFIGYGFFSSNLGP